MALSALNRMAMRRAGEIGRQTYRVGHCVSVLRLHMIEQGNSLDQAAAALGRTVETLGKGAKVVTDTKLASQAARSRVEAGHAAAREAAEAAAAMVAPTQRLSELISLVAETGFETHLLSGNREAAGPSACTPIGQTSTIGHDLGSAAQRCSAVAKEMRALIFEIEGHALNGSTHSDKAADAMAEAEKHLASVDAIDGNADAAKLQSSLAESRLRVKCSARLATSGVGVAEETNALAEQVAVAADGLRRLLSCCTATDQSTVAAAKPAAQPAKHQPDLKIVGGSAFPDGT